MKPDNIVVRPGKCVGCLRCQLICTDFYAETYNPIQAWVVIERGGMGYNYGISFTEDCTSCGLCAENCAFDALTLK